LALSLTVTSFAQIFEFSREEMIKYTPLNPFERFPDGRPKVPDSILERIKALSVEEAWGLLRGKGYHNQYEGDFQILHPGQKLVGRAVTAQYLPARPDLDEILLEDAKRRGVARGNTQKVVDRLQKKDVPVVDVMGAAPGHNFGGDNIAAGIYGATGTGSVVFGTIRDLEGTYELPLQIYFKGPHPSAVSGVNVIGINIPIRVGDAMVMPGDVVLGDRTGVVFIPPHIAEEVVDRADEVHIHDEWTKEKLLTGKYKTSELYGGPLSPEHQKEYEEYKKRKMEELAAKRRK
jgi:regulator of RNase E activity RraA